MSDDISRQIEEDVRRLEQHSSATAVLRQKVINKLAGVVDKMEINTEADKPSLIDAKMNVMSTFLRAIDDSEKRPENLIKLKQKIKSDKASEAAMSMISNTVTEYMRRLGNSAKIELPNSEGPASHDELDNVVAGKNFEILDDELTFATTTAKDIDQVKVTAN